jgi:hypothetical protein
MKVWCFDKETKTIELRNVDKVARNPRWYSLKTDKQTYDNEVEETFGIFEQYDVRLIGKVRGWIDLANRQSVGLDSDKPFDATLTEAEKAYLASYIALHILRVPTSFGRIRDMAEKRAATDAGLVAAFRDAYGSGDFGNLALVGFLEASRNLVPGFIESLLKKNLTIHFSGTRLLDLLTGDQPVIRSENAKIVLFPIFQRAFLHFEGVGERIQMRKEFDERLASFLNISICKAAEKQVFGCNPETLVKFARQLGLEHKVVEQQGDED